MTAGPPPGGDPRPAAFSAIARSALTYTGIGLYALLVGPLGILIAFASGSVGLLYALARGGVRLGLALSGIRFRVTGQGLPPAGGPVVYCANHASNVDAPILFLVLHPRVKMLFKVEFMRMPILGQAARLAGFIPVERQNPERSQRAVDAATDALARGETFLVFPEGTRSRSGELLPFKKGAFVMAIKSQVPVVPVAIEGARAAMQKGSVVIHPVTVTVRIGRPVDTTGLTLDDRDRLAATVRQQVSDMLDEGRRGA